MLQQLLRKRNDEHTQIRPYLVTCLPGRTTAASQRVAASFGPNSPVDLSHCIYREDRIEPASCYVLRCADTGSRTVVNHNDLEDMSTAEFEGVVQSFAPDQDTWWHFEVTSIISTPCLLGWLSFSLDFARGSHQLTMSRAASQARQWRVSG